MCWARLCKKNRIYLDLFGFKDVWIGRKEITREPLWPWSAHLSRIYHLSLQAAKYLTVSATKCFMTNILALGITISQKIKMYFPIQGCIN
jgi:hypothetical protein